MLTQTRMEAVGVPFSSMGPVSGQFVFLLFQNPEMFFHVVRSKRYNLSYR